MVRALAELNLFETSSFTAADRERGALYRQAAARQTVAASFTNVGEYLQSLEMKIAVRPFDAVQLPRIAQLIQRSNQFNLTTRRYGAAECEALMRDAACTPLYVSLEDRFGDYGLISVVVAKHAQDVARLDLWLMSCRVLSRGVEEFIDEPHRRAGARPRRASGARRVRPDRQEQMVQDFYGRFGFEEADWPRQRPRGSSSALTRRRYVPREMYHPRGGLLHPPRRRADDSTPRSTKRSAPYSVRSSTRPGLVI